MFTLELSSPHIRLPLSYGPLTCTEAQGDEAGRNRFMQAQEQVWAAVSQALAYELL